MPTSIQAPDGTEVQFPDSMTVDQINEVIKKNPPKVLQQPADKLQSGGENADVISPMKAIGAGVDYASRLGGEALSTVGNIPADVYNTAARMTGRFAPVKRPFSADKSIIPEAVKKAAKGAFEEEIAPLVPLPDAAISGLEKAGGKAVNALTTPSSISTFPLLEAKLGRAAMGIVMASQAPEQISQAEAVFKDPKSTATDKWEALGTAGINLAMTAGIALSLKPEAVKETLTPEEAAKAVEKKSIKGGNPIVETVPKAFPSDVITGDVNAPKKEVIPDAAPIQKEQTSVQVERPGNGQGGPPPEAGARSSVPSPTDVGTPAAQKIAPLNPGGALEDLPPELQAKSNSVKDAMAAQFAALKAQAAAKPNEVPPKVSAEENSNPETAKAAVPEKQETPAVPVMPANAAVAKQPELVGMGGAVPSEFENSPKTPTGIKNATVDAERAQRGLPSAIQPARRGFGEVWDRAMAAIDRDPTGVGHKGVQDRLLDELRDNPRALNDTEDAIVLHRQIDLHNDYGKATRDLAQAAQDGDAGRMQEASTRIASISDALQDIYDIGKQSGTETGRGLNARKMMAYEDFSLAQMELTKRAANGGKTLTDAERADLTKLHDQISDLQKKHDDYVAASRERISKMEADAKLKEIQQQSEKEPQIHPEILKQAKRIVETIHNKADAARARLKERLSRTSAGLDPTILGDLALIGADHLATAALNVADWSVKMASDLGESWGKFKDHAQEIYDASNLVIKDATKDNLTAAREMRSKSPEEQIKANAEKIGDKLKQGKKNEIAWYVQRIARLLVQSGVKDREALIDQVHSILQTHMPDITRRETMDAISGYGDFKQLSKDQISLQLRGMKGEMQQLAKLEDMAAGEPPKKTGVERRTPTEAERKLVKLVNESKFRFQVPITDPATQLKSALDTFKTNARNRISDLQDKIDRGDFASKPKRELQLDNAALKLKSELEKAKQKFRDGVIRDRMSKRSLSEKAQDTLVKWGRGFLLSGPTTLAKLTAAAFWRLAANPVEAGVGAAIGKLPGISKISERAPLHGGDLSIKAESKAITEGFTKGLDDAKQVITTGKGVLDRVFGGRNDMGVGETDEAQKSVVDFFGQLHGALKAPVKRAAFARYFQKATEFNLKNGVDVTDPMVQTRMAVQAYKEANRDIFMQPNRYSDRVKRFINSLEEKDKVSGNIPTASKLAATGARLVLPIMKVPANIVAETLEYAIGLETGSYKAGKAMRNGVENLNPEEANIIMRQLKKGSVGTAALLTGYFAPQFFGGFYRKGEKRKPDEVPYGAAKIAGETAPRVLLHFPLIEAMQLGSTVRRVSDSKLKKKDKDTQGIGGGIYAGALGLADDVPFLDQMFQFGKIADPNQKGQYWGELAKSRIVPQMISQTAEYLDKDAKGNAVKRDPKTIPQHIESGIPGLRDTLPKKKSSK